MTLARNVIDTLDAETRLASLPQQPEDDEVLVRIHLHGGTVAETLIADSDVDGTVEEYVERAITEPPKPHWAWIGGIYLFTQAVSGIEIADNEEEG